MVQIAIPYAYGCTVRVYAYGMYHTRTVRNTRTVSNIPISQSIACAHFIAILLSDFAIIFQQSAAAVCTKIMQ